MSEERILKLKIGITAVLLISPTLLVLLTFTGQ